MADLKGTYRSPNGSPYFDYEVTYSETGRNGSSAKYRVNLRIKMTSSQSRYGYGIRAYVKINGAKVEKQIKNPSSVWSGSSWQGTWSFDVSASAGTSGGTLPAEVKIWGTDGGSAPNMTIGGKTVSLSTWNTAPYWTSDDGNMNGWKENKIIPENTGVVHIYPPKATDREGNRINYDTWRYVNDQNVAKACQNGNVNGFDDDISAYGQGAKIKYRFRVDDYDAFSEYKWSWVYTKNKLTPANISVSGSIGFDTGSIPVSLTGHSNTNGNTDFTFNLTSPNFTIYNGSNLKALTSITIFKGGTAPSTPYINFDDLKNFVRSNAWRGTATINLETKNPYGSKATKSTTINIDLRTAPTTVSTVNVTGDYAVAGGRYFIPSRGAIGINWSGASDKLGGAITYELQGGFTDGAWTTLKDGLTGTSTQISLDAVTRARNYRFRIVAKTNFGYNSQSAEKVITLHYYNQPKISIRNVNRSATQYSAEILTETDTSITSIAINSRQWQDKNGTYHNFAGSPYRFTQDDLGETDSYTKQIKCSDNSGFPEATAITNYQVSSYIPIVAIRKKGLGINALADDVYKLKVGGRARAWAFVNEGYETNNPAGNNVNKWVKVASFRVTGRYEDASATIDFLDSGSGSSDSYSGRLRCRLKQQNDFGQPSSISLVLENPTAPVSTNDFYLVVTKNVYSEVIAELWFRCSMSYTSVYFYPSQALGEVTMYSRQPFQNGIPAGQNYQAKYSPRETLEGLGASPSSHNHNYSDLQNLPLIKTDGGAVSAPSTGWISPDIMNLPILVGASYGKDGNVVFCSDGSASTNMVIDGDFYGGNGKRKALLDTQSSPLWKGYHHMTAKETVYPSKKLSQCNNGWILVWSDFNTGGTGEDYNFCFTYISKNTPWKSGQGYNFCTPTDMGDTAYTAKYIYVYDDHISGHATNRDGRRDDVVIRAILEF